MSKIRVALTGPGGTGKTYIVSKLKERLEERGLKVGVVPSPTRRIASLGFGFNKDTDWVPQLLFGVQRVVTEREVDQGVDVLLADRALSCELGYTELAIADKGSGDEKMLRTLRTLSDLWMGVEKDFWDILAFKRIDPEFPPEADGERIDDLSWHEKTSQLIYLWANYYGPIVYLPTNRDDALEVLWGTIATRLEL